MRTVLRKLYRHQELNTDEYGSLMKYAEDLRNSSPESYGLFHERFASLLYQDYHTYLPRFTYGMDAVYEFLCQNPSLVEELQSGVFSLEMFPPHLHEYLQSAYAQDILAASMLPTLEIMKPNHATHFNLPKPRTKSLVCKYESGNPYKEIGLKSHFDRLGTYSFVSRLQSIRYLRGRKASEDKIEPVAGDCLAGIFTNKEKSIYYYIFLTENDGDKANNACQVLNKALYGNNGEGS